jgi:hypothetical protein
MRCFSEKAMMMGKKKEVRWEKCEAEERKRERY